MYVCPATGVGIGRDWRETGSGDTCVAGRVGVDQCEQQIKGTDKECLQSAWSGLLQLRRAALVCPVSTVPCGDQQGMGRLNQAIPAGPPWHDIQTAAAVWQTLNAHGRIFDCDAPPRRVLPNSRFYRSSNASSTLWISALGRPSHVNFTSGQAVHPPFPCAAASA